MEKNAWRRLVAAGVLGVALTACGGSESDGPADATQTDVQSPEPEPVDETADAADSDGGSPDESEDPADDDVATGAADPVAPDEASDGGLYDAEATPLAGWFTPFEPGIYRTDAVGTPTSFTTAERLSTQPNGGGHFVLSDVSSQGPDDRGLVFMRIGAFTDPAAPNTPVGSQTAWPNDDFLGWLENRPSTVIASEPIETTLGGKPALQVDLSLDETAECGFAPGACVGFVLNNGQDIKALNPGSSYRVWVVNQGDEDPLLVSADIARPEDAAWFDRADAVLDSVAFGDLQPNPARPLDPGANEYPVFGGVAIVWPENISALTNGDERLVTVWASRGFHEVPLTGAPGTVTFADKPLDVQGIELGSADDLIAAIAALGIATAELEPVIVDGVTTRVFDVQAAGPPTIALRFASIDLQADDLGWFAPLRGRIWLIEHPERGLMMLSANDYGPDEASLGQTREIAEAIVSSLVFVD